ncbi:probable aminopeptidase NPEPL1 [Hyalella azteca]|uniref:Probable aminopeptidase NPEPL1 n=1 Tax=Hyalella azteca TaxID=294128 RepID=A0A8B7NCL6_HYAAZ|nr:probable aminopeptidase NPEPL1 [Hyalella azteca]
MSRKMCIKDTTVQVSTSLTPCDPQKNPVLIIGQLKHLQLLNFADISAKLGNRVTETVWSNGVKGLQPSPTDCVSLYLNLCSVAALPTRVTRHNTNSRAHHITKIVRSHTVAADEEYIVLVCERRDVYASVCAVARAYSLYSRKSSVVNSDRKQTITIEVILAGSDTEELSAQDLVVLDAAIFGIRLAACIVDTPAQEMTTTAFIEEIESVGSKLNIVPVVIQGEELKKRGFGGLWGVGKAAECPPALVILSHTPPGASQNIAWVGKGIVYDTGGLSMKTKTTMPGMKRDCGGAAGILGAFYVAVKSGFDQNLHAVFCLAENAVSPKATKPDDIHTLYSGRSVEINNTDAEGRLVLGDGVVYAYKDLKCDTILDMATLTGAQATATGKYHAAVVSNNDELEQCAVRAGRVSGELAHALPYCPELHFPEFASVVADMKNSAADRNNASSSCAGLFIAAQLGFDFSGLWLHIDMAAPVYLGERATGYGVGLLPCIFGEHSQSKLLRSLSTPLPSASSANTNNNEESGPQNDRMQQEQPSTKKTRLE